MFPRALRTDRRSLSDKNRRHTACRQALPLAFVGMYYLMVVQSRRQASDAQRRASRWILDHESVGDSANAGASAAFVAALERLGQTFANIVTAPGATVLLSRALFLASAEHPELRVVVSRAPAERLSHLGERLAAIEPQEAAAAAETIFANAISLLATFIGDDLVARRLRSTWAQLPDAGPPIDRQEAPL